VRFDESATSSPQLPVERVSWNDVQEFLGKINVQISDGIASLPTEAQREYACRAGTQGEFSGQSLEEMGWDGFHSDRHTHPVKQKKPNAWGLYDMHGNVSEWCADWHGDDYKPDPVTDPLGAESGRAKICRGGSWADSAFYCRSAHRGAKLPDSRWESVGFRFCILPKVP